MSVMDWNPRVVLWAKEHGVDLEKLERRDDEEMYSQDGEVPWTVSYSQWVHRKWRDFFLMCHGTETRGECCSGLRAQKRFDTWLRELRS